MIHLDNQAPQTAVFPQGATIGSNIQWMKTCGASSSSVSTGWGRPGVHLLQGHDNQSSFAAGMFGALFAALFMLAVLAASKYFKRSRRGRIALRADGVSTSSPLSCRIVG